jgi:hypothetical protein
MCLKKIYIYGWPFPKKLGEWLRVKKYSAFKIARNM